MRLDFMAVIENIFIFSNKQTLTVKSQLQLSRRDKSQKDDYFDSLFRIEIKAPVIVINKIIDSLNISFIAFKKYWRWILCHRNDLVQNVLYNAHMVQNSLYPACTIQFRTWYVTYIDVFGNDENFFMLLAFTETWVHKYV